MELKPSRKPRDFYIEFSGDPNNDEEINRRYVSNKKFHPIGLNEEVIHCREVLNEPSELEAELLYKCFKWRECAEAILNEMILIRKQDNHFTANALIDGAIAKYKRTIEK